jgi:hypothetical protein
MDSFPLLENGSDEETTRWLERRDAIRETVSNAIVSAGWSEQRTARKASS